MYKECADRWRYRPSKNTLEAHLISQHLINNEMLDPNIFKKVLKLFLTYINMQYKRAV